MRGSSKLKAWRDRKGLTQAEAAEQLGTHQGTWGAWEMDRKRPDLRFILALETLTEGAVVTRDWLGKTTKLPKKPKLDAAAE
jgi:transcriptional regulator with XRE-family HTH domain